VIGGLSSFFALAVEGRVGPAAIATLAITGVGAIAALIVPTLYGRDASGLSRFSAGLRLGVPGAVIVLTVVALVVAASDGTTPERLAVTSGSAHDHDAPAPGEPTPIGSGPAAPAPTVPRAPVIAEAMPAGQDSLPPPVVGKWDTVGNPFADQTCADGGPFGGDHSHGHVHKAPLDQATQTAVDTQVDTAQASALRYPTVAAAEAAGYRLTTTDLSCIAAHYVRWDITVDDWGTVDATFDPADPEILLYDGTAPSSPLVGASYLALTETKPEGFVGGNDDWYRHLWMCLTDGVVSGLGVPSTACDGLNQRWFSGHDIWMAHAWVVPGYENRLGVFADGLGKLA